MLLRFYGLAEDRFLADVLLPHGTGSFFHVVEGLGDDRCRMGNDALRRGIHLYHCAAARTSNLEGGHTFRHRLNHTPVQRARSLIGKMWNRLSNSQPSSANEVHSTSTARISPKPAPRRACGSRRFATNPRMFSVANPKTSIHRML